MLHCLPTSRHFLSRCPPIGHCPLFASWVLDDLLIQQAKPWRGNSSQERSNRAPFSLASIDAVSFLDVTPRAGSKFRALAEAAKAGQFGVGLICCSAVLCCTPMAATGSSASFFCTATPGAGELALALFIGPAKETFRLADGRRWGWCRCRSWCRGRSRCRLIAAPFTAAFALAPGPGFGAPGPHLRPLFTFF